MADIRFEVRPIGWVQSPLRDPELAPKQGDEGAPDAWIEFRPEVLAGLKDLRVDTDIILLTWLDRADRSRLVVHPRDDPDRPPTGVFSTRSADRPNPIGLHRVRLAAIEGNRILVHNLEAVDGTPIVDVKPLRAPTS